MDAMQVFLVAVSVVTIIPVLVFARLQWILYKLKLAQEHATAYGQCKFRRGDHVRKISGSEWTGRIVGEYSTDLTHEGYVVESGAHKGSVQLYPAKALEIVK